MGGSRNGGDDDPHLEMHENLSSKLDRELLERAYNHSLWAAESAGALTREVAAFKVEVRELLHVFKAEMMRELRRSKRESHRELEKLEVVVEEIEDTKTHDLREALKEEKAFTRRLKWFGFSTTVAVVLGSLAYLLKHVLK